MHSSSTVFLRSVNKFVHDRQDESIKKEAMIFLTVFIEIINDFHEDLSVFFGFTFNVCLEMLRLQV